MTRFAEFRIVGIALSLLYFGIVSNAQAEKVVIVGAGLSGLTTAYRLQQAFESENQFRDKHWEVELFEAKDRSGGRVFTVNLDGSPVELGGENINDGGDAENIRRILKEMGLKTSPRLVVLEDSYYFDPTDRKSYQIYKELMPSFPKISQKEIEKTLLEIEKKSENLEQVIDAFFQQYRPEDEKLARKFQILKIVVSHWMKSYEGGDVRTLSVRYAHGSLLTRLIGLQAGYEAIQMGKPQTYPVESIQGGNSSLVLALAQRLGSKLHLKSPLQELRRTPAHLLEASFGGARSGSVQADIVVLTLPCPVYKKIKFGEGTVPVDRLSRIDSVPYGSHAKILIHGELDNRNTSVFTNGMSGWINSERKHATLYFSGNAGIMKDQVAFSKNLDLGIETYGRGGIDLKKGPVVIPTEIFSINHTPVGMSWATDPYIGGSYSYYSPGMAGDLETEKEVDGEKVLPLFAPIDGRIFFAGEHTTVDQDIRGTMEAAVESGEKTSRLIIKQLKRNLAEKRAPK